MFFSRRLVIERSTCGRRMRMALAPLLVAVPLLAGCSGGADTMTQPYVPPAADLDTARPPPTTVTSTPLLPPVPESPSQPTAVGAVPASAEQPPLQYEHLYSDEEQLRLKSDLAAAAARVQKP